MARAHSMMQRIRDTLHAISPGLRVSSTRPVATRGYLVLGMHRSGTSCLTGLLETCGLTLGDVSRRNPFNLKGTMESKYINRANNRILEAWGGSWNEPPAQAEVTPDLIHGIHQALTRFTRSDGWLIKDPRITLTLDHWMPSLANVTLIGSIRHPLSVAGSLNRRDGMSMDRGLELWLEYNRKLIEHFEKHQFPIINFDLPPLDYIAQVERLCTIVGLKFDTKSALKFFDHSLVTQSSKRDVQLSGDVNDAYSYLLKHQLDFDRSSVPRKSA